VPLVLDRLPHAEKMLIQRVSPFVPLHHIKQGTFGLAGHVCAFEQDINGIAHVLPRLATESGVIRIVQDIKNEVGGEGESQSKAFRVRKHFVLEALSFLKSHNGEYEDITIDPSRLDWIQGEEGELDSYVVTTENLKTSKDDSQENADMGQPVLNASFPGVIKLTCSHLV
jgi:hypothetical protein